jgi:hypothetical protein
LCVTAFLGYDRWNHFAAEELARAAEGGRREVLGRVLEEAAKCRPFTVANGEENTELIGTRCLSQARATAAPQDTPGQR